MVFHSDSINRPREMEERGGKDGGGLVFGKGDTHTEIEIGVE